MSHTNIKLYGTTWCSDCKRAKQFFGEQRVHYDFIDVDADAGGMAYVEQVNEGKQIIPVILFEDGSTLVLKVVNVGDMLGHIPLPAKITVETLPPIDLRAEFGPDPDVDEIYDHVIRLMQDTLDSLAAERRLPVLG